MAKKDFPSWTDDQLVQSLEIAIQTLGERHRLVTVQQQHVDRIKAEIERRNLRSLFGPAPGQVRRKRTRMPLAALLLLAGLSAVAAPAQAEWPTKADLEKIGLVERTDHTVGGREYSVQAGDGSWVTLDSATWVGGHLGWADKTLQGGH